LGFPRTSKSEPKMQENLKSGLYCIFRHISPDTFTTVKRVNYFKEVVTERKVSGIIVIGKNLKLGPCHIKITTLQTPMNSKTLFVQAYVNTEFFAFYSSELQGT
jgi:hypothetical protein